MQIMRIGIFTHTPKTNYGGILQAYALQTVLERMGNEVVVFDKPFTESRIPLWKKPLSYTKRFINWYVLHKRKIHLFQEKFNYQREKTSRKYTQQFIDKYIHRFVINDLPEIRQEDLDAIVVGSDQIWRMHYFKFMWSKKSADAFLAFTNSWNIKRIAYAASFGTDSSDIPNNEIELCKEMISKFDAVSVREDSGVKICDTLFGIKADRMPDPTLLLGKEDYINLIPNYSYKSQKTQLLSYMLDDNAEKEILRRKISIWKKLYIKITNTADNWKEGEAFMCQPPVEEWLRAFAESEYVITDSFHACVFSIIFHRQFTVVANKERGMARFLSLLKTFGLEDRLIQSPSDYHPLPDIDYSKINKILNLERRKGFSFLKNNLE